MLMLAAVVFDMTINLGLILHLAAILGAGFLFWGRLEGRLSVMEERLSVQDEIMKNIATIVDKLREQVWKQRR